MNAVWKHRPSPAMVVAIVALIVALGGTGYAAIKLPANSVGTAQLKKDAVTSLKVKNTTCAKGKAVTLAFNKCRTAGGKPQGKCNRRVGRYTCTERRYDAVPHVQYSSKVTCASGSKRVLSTYTQNT